MFCGVIFGLKRTISIVTKLLSAMDKVLKHLKSFEIPYKKNK